MNPLLDKILKDLFSFPGRPFSWPTYYILYVLRGQSTEQICLGLESLTAKVRRGGIYQTSDFGIERIDYAYAEAKAEYKARGLPTGVWSYSTDFTPPGYVCAKCKVSGVRLYRDYNTFLDHQELTCTACTIAASDKDVDLTHPHNLGWKVAAVPTEENDTYWGYTSVPTRGVWWWDHLPIKKE
jgi:hypothetical protein